MASLPVLVPGCDNCLSVDSSAYDTWLSVLALAGVLLGAGILVVTRRALRRSRLYAAAAAACLGIALPAALALNHLPISVHGTICGGALNASRQRGFPTDAALDPTQSACKHRGQTVVDYAASVWVGALLVGAVMTTASVAGSRRSRTRRHRASSLP